MISATTFLMALGVTVLASTAAAALAVLSAPAGKCRCRCGAGKHQPAPPVKAFDAHAGEAVAVGNTGRANRSSP